MRRWTRGLYTSTLGSKYRERFPSAVPQWYKDGSTRTGVLALKVGMTALWDQWGRHMPISVLHVDNCEVVQVKRHATEGHTALQLGAGEAKPKNVPPTLRGHFAKAGMSARPKRKLGEFPVTPDAVLPVGTRLEAAHFVPGQFVDVSGVTKSKGWQGPMKRWGFRGQGASHGVSRTHRAHGSTGQCQDPGRVLKGKKMAGRMGGDRQTVQNMWVYKVDTEKQLIYIRGHVPGPKGDWVRVCDAVKRPGFHRLPDPKAVPFPTIAPDATLPREIEADVSARDPALAVKAG